MINAFRAKYPHYDDMTDKALTDALHAKHFDHMDKQDFETMFHNPPQEGDDAAQDMPDYTSGAEPFSQNRLDFELGLVKNQATSKSAVMLPQTSTLKPTEVARLAKKNGMKAIIESGATYIFDPKQIKEDVLRSEIKSGKNGHVLGYGTESVPAQGIDYAVNLDGHGTTDISTIKQWRDADQLGFAGRAPSLEEATAKIREMGRDDADITVPQNQIEGAQHAETTGNTAANGQVHEESTQTGNEGQSPAEVQQAEEMKWKRIGGKPSIREDQ